MIKFNNIYFIQFNLQFTLNVIKQQNKMTAMIRWNLFKLFRNSLVFERTTEFSMGEFSMDNGHISPEDIKKISYQINRLVVESTIGSLSSAQKQIAKDLFCDNNNSLTQT